MVRLGYGFGYGSMRIFISILFKTGGLRFDTGEYVFVIKPANKEAPMRLQSVGEERREIERED
ncbi:MAG: hypothetical protein M1477_05710 [Candidatus Thermoplasmatota archaeon]|nr:hypothetical protein [Candidatus Thermoplasmatota archaeon]